MKASSIKVGHVYYVDFDPVRDGEFAKDHMAVVLKKNVDMVTYAVIPLTSKESGVGLNKIELNISDLLPPHLRGRSTYAVYDQLRTVSASRFKKLFEGGKEYDTELPREEFEKLLCKVIDNLVSDLDDSIRAGVAKSLFTTEAT